MKMVRGKKDCFLHGNVFIQPKTQNIFCWENLCIILLSGNNIFKIIKYINSVSATGLVRIKKFTLLCETNL